MCFSISDKKNVFKFKTIKHIVLKQAYKFNRLKSILYRNYPKYSINIK